MVTTGRIIGVTIALVFCMALSVGAEWNGPWPDTGQSKCYDNQGEIPCPEPGEDFYGQDAQYQGPQHSYTKLGHGGVELPDDAAHADNGGEWIMTRDNMTGLIWELKTDLEDLQNKDNTYTWCSAVDSTYPDGGECVGSKCDTYGYIETLNSHEFGGCTDWRLPTSKEISSIIDSGAYDPAINLEWFPNSPSPGGYWTSTPHAGTLGFFIANIHIQKGIINYATKNCSRHIRAVRGGKNSVKDLIFHNDGTFTDKNTGLIWQESVPNEAYTWDKALLYIDELALAGHSDWRLPNRNELESLLDYSTYEPAIDPLLAPNTISSPYWSSTTSVNNAQQAWRVNFDHAHVLIYDKINAFQVRAVRAGQFSLAYSVGPNGKITGDTLQIVVYGSAGTDVQVTADTGYHFIKWNDGVETATRTDTNVKSNITVTAEFAINQYTATFKDHDATVLKYETVNHGSSATAPDDPVRKGYAFTGWDTAFDNVTTDLDVTAGYTINQYTITFDSAGGTAVDAIIQGYGTAVPAPADPTRVGYTFGGWSPAVPATMPAEDLTLMAQWAINQYTVTFRDHDGTELKSELVTHGGRSTAPEDPEREGYTFSGWDVEFDNITADLVVTAQYTANLYTISFDSQGGSEVNPITGDFDTEVTVPEGSSREGYTFLCWNTAADGSGDDYASRDTLPIPVDGLTLYAQWAINEYTLTYVAGDHGSISGETPQTVEHGSDGSSVEAVPEEGYQFVEWSDGSTQNPRIDTNVNNNINVEANYNYLLGDVDLNGRVDLVDAVLLLRYAAGLDTLTDLQKRSGNIAGHQEHNDVGIEDAIAILKVLVRAN